MRHFSFVVVLLILPPAWGQHASQAVMDPVAGRTAEELVTHALSANGEILAGRQQVAGVRGGVAQARLKANPSLDVNGSRQVPGTMNTFTLGGSLPLELYHRRERRVDVAESETRLAALGQSERERQLRGQVEATFGEVLASVRNLQVIEELLDANRKALELTEVRANQGAIPTLDAKLLRVEVNRIDSQRVDLEAKMALALLDLKNLIGMRPEESLTLKGSLEATPAINDDATIMPLIATRPDILAARSAVDVAGARLRQAETDARPDATVSANYQRLNSSFDLNGLNAAGQIRPIQGIFHFLSVGVSITLPARNRNQGAIETSVAQVEEAKNRRQYAELTASREVAAALISRDKAQESLRIFREGVRDLARQNLEVVRRTYELGRTQLLDVIAEQRRFIDIDMGYTEALNRAYQAAVRLRIVTGGK
jgi:cobalt-zinc-cadmium efflux system outer membrane protein